MIERGGLIFDHLRREPRLLIEPAVWLVICGGFIAFVEITGDNSFGYFSQSEKHNLLWPLVVGGFINAATFYANAFVLMPRFLERRAFGRYFAFLTGLWIASAVAQTGGQAIVIALAEPTLREVGFVDLTRINLATAPFVILLSALYKVARDWYGHIRERGGLNEQILHLSRELDVSRAALRDQAAGVEPMLRLESGREELQIPLADIAYVKAASNYVEIVAQTRRYLVYGQLKNIVPLLPKPRFVRVHRSTIVALDRIRVVDGSALTLDDTKLTVGPSYDEEFRAAWQSWTQRSETTRAGA